MTTETEIPCRDQAALNAEFLGLVVAGTQVQLPGRAAQRLSGLGEPVRRRLGALPFALFGFGFEDEAGWERLLSPGVRDLVPPYVRGDARVERFPLLALTTLRGFARMAPRSASAWSGLPVVTRARLAELDIGLLPPVAVLAAPRLRGRLALRESGWLRLLDAAEREDERQLELLAALGKQWTIRRALGISRPTSTGRRFRR
jgi:hypothetical protein